MVDLPRQERPPGRWNAFWRAFWHWFERDTNQTHQLSPVLGFAALIPPYILDEIGAADIITVPLWFLGWFMAVGWMVYVFYRRATRIAQDVRQSFDDHKAIKRGEEIPTRCPECGQDLPDWSPPDDHHSYDFRGWICENCDTMVDEYGRRA